VSLFEITHVERSGWQRRAAAELTRVLDTHRDLPLIAWTVSPAGAILVGRVNTFASAAQACATFEAWRVALALSEHSQTATGDGAAFLRASITRNHVRLVLTATVFDDTRPAS